MKRKRLFAWLTAIVMLVSLLPAGAMTASASGNGYKTVLVGIIEWVYNNYGDDFRVHYWGGTDGVGDATLNYYDDSTQKSLGQNFWNDNPQPFRLYIAKVPADATGFAVWDPNSNLWYGSSDGDLALHDRAFVFEYGGTRYAYYESPVTTINDPRQWAELAADVELGLDYSYRTVTMMSGVATDVTIGREDRPFRGCFDGGNNLLTIYADDPGAYGVAPFRCISDGAVIQNLIVTGDVIGGWHSGGLVGFCQGGTQSEPNRIDNCRVETNVTADSYGGGVVGHGTSSVLVIQNTMYSGVLSDAGSYCGGFQGWGDGNDLTVTDCLYNGTYTGTGNFDPIAIGYGQHSFTNAYYVEGPTPVNTEGSPVSLVIPHDSLATPDAVLGIQIWIRGQTEITGVDDWYPATGTEHPINPAVNYNGNPLTEGVDYTWDIDGQTVTGVTDKGIYKLNINGAGAYAGSVSKTITVVPASLEGQGSEGEPWRINDGADWVRFALNIAGGDSYSGEYVKLFSDIPASVKAGTVNGGTQEHPFSGVFDGGGCTVFADITDVDNQGTALFSYIEGATIKNLNVTGVVRGDYHAAGLVGFAKTWEDEDHNRPQNRIENCVVDTNVYGGDYVGGIVGHALRSDLEIENCLFTGLLASVSNQSNTKGALLGWDDPDGTKTITHCCYVMRDEQNTDNLELLAGLSGQVVVTDCYRTGDVCQMGAQVYQFQPSDRVCGWVEVAGHAFALPCEISGVPTVCNCAGGPVTLSPVVTFQGTPLTEDTDYELEIVQTGTLKNAAAYEPGRYELRVNGIGSFDGTQSFSFQVGSITWAVEQDQNSQPTILHISGVGPMEDLEPYPYDGTGRYGVAEIDMGNITTVVIDVGVTAIGDYAFDGFPNLEKALIPAGMVKVGEYAFTASSSAFTELRLPPSLQIVEKGAFQGLGNVTDLWTGRDAQAWQDFLNSPSVETEDNQILTGWNDSWQWIDIHDPVSSDIITGPTLHGSVSFAVESQAPVFQASDGQLVTVIPDPDGGYELEELHVTFLENNVPYTFSVRPITAFTMAFGTEVTVTPLFRTVVYSLTYDGLTGVNPLPVNPSSYTVETPDFTLNNPAKTGYVFDGWTLNGSTVPVPNVTVYRGSTGDRQYTANWTPNTYFVRFDPNGGAGTMPDQSFAYDASQTLDLNAFTNIGYVFTGWNTQPDGSGASYSDGQTVSNLTAVNNGVVTLYAQWAPISYTVHFDANGGTSSMPDQSFVFDTAQNLRPNTITRPCYNFAFWNTQPDGSGLSFTDRELVMNLTTVDNDVVTLYAIWDPYHYQVHFEPNGGSGNMPDQNFDYDMPQALNQNTYRFVGYDFTEWNTQPDGSGTSYSDCAVVVNLTAVENGLVTLHAIWTPITYFVAFDPNGGTGNMPDQVFTYGTPQNLDANVFNMVGYSFTGWNTQPDGSGAAYADQASVSNLTSTAGDVVTLYAQWSGVNYTVHFDPNNTNATGNMADQPFVYGTPQALTPNAFNVPGHAFVAWNTAPDGSGTSYADCDTVSDLTTVSGGVVTLYAQWQANIFIVHFEPNGGTGAMPDQSFTYGVPQILDANQFSRLGYDFAGWNDAPDGMGTSYAVGVPLNITGDVALFAQWTPITYTVHYDPNGAPGGGMADQSFTYDQPAALDPIGFQFPGCTFDYWDDAQNGGAYPDQTVVSNLSAVNGATVTLVAQWKPNDYTVVFAPNAPANSFTGVMPSQSFTYGVTQNLILNAFNRPGYTFLYWNTAPDGSGTSYNDGVVPNITPTAFGQTVVLYAIWQAHTYNIRFDPNQGTGTQMPDQSFTYDVPQPLSRNTYTMANYVFVGWCFDIEGNDIIYQDEEVVANLTDQDGVTLTLYAIWEPIHCTVIFHPNGAPGGDYSQVLYWNQGQTLLPNAFVYPGHGFTNWLDVPSGTGTLSFTDQQAPGNFWNTNGQIIDLYAQWRPSQYTVVFDPNGGTGSMPDQPFVYGSYQTLTPLGFSRPGYSFGGWLVTYPDGTTRTLGDGDLVNPDLTDIDNDVVVLVAQWTPYQYIIRFSPNPPGNLVPWDGAMLDMPMTYDQGRNLGGNAYTCQGYHFSHWNTRTDDSGTSYANQAFVNICPAYNGEIIVLFAQWKANTYTVVFDSNGGTGSMTNQLFTYNQYGTLQLNVFTRVGYTFTGWNTKADGTGTTYADGATISNLTSANNGSVTLYAQWRPNTYTVHFDRNGGFLGVMPDQSFIYDVAQPLSPNVYLHQTDVFYSWNTMADGSGISYADCESVLNLTAVDGGVVTLYAQWGPQYWTVSDNVIGDGAVTFRRSATFATGTVVYIDAVPGPGNILQSISAEYYDVEGMPLALDLEKVADVENCWTFVMPAGNVLITAVFGPAPADGFYLIGPDWTVSAIDPANCFNADPTMEGQYQLQTTLTAGQQLKVVRLAGGAIAAWYPDGYGNEYTVDADHAGEKTVYFRENYYDDWAAYGGYIWIEANAPAPQEPILVEGLRLRTNLSAGIEIAASIVINPNQMNEYDSWYIQVDKLDADGSVVATKRYGEGQENPVTYNGTVAITALYKDVKAREMSTQFVASLHCFKDGGQEYYKVDTPTSFKEYLCGVLLKGSSSAKTKTLAADMLAYGAAAQVYFDYNTGDLANENLGDAADAYELYRTKTQAPAALVNTNSSNVRANPSLQNRMVLGLTARSLSATGEMTFEIKDGDGNVKAIVEGSAYGSAFTGSYSGLEARDMRTAYTITPLIDGVAAGTPAVWSMEGFVREKRANANTSAAELAVLNALLVYTDSVYALTQSN